MLAPQIYVEIERARLTRPLARMTEEEGAVQEAAEILQEVAVVSGRGG
jgi:26S proteasome regulatory subunit N5